MFQTDNSEDEQCRIVKKRKAVKPNRMGIFFKRNKWKILVAGIVTAFLMYASSVSSIGYTGTVNVDPKSAELMKNYLISNPGWGGMSNSFLWWIRSTNHTGYGFVYTAYINVYFNPFLYPISHLTGAGKISSSVVRWSGSTYPYPQCPVDSGVAVADSVMRETLLRESLRNLPYMSFLGLVLAFGIGKFFGKIKSHFGKSAQ